MGNQKFSASIQYIGVYTPVCRVPPRPGNMGPIQKRVIIMSIKQDSKTIVRNTVALPLTAAATTLEVASDVSNLALGTVRGAIPTTKRLGSIVGMFVTGMFNSELDEQEAKKLYKETTLETVFTKIEEASLKAGQDLVKAWDDESITKSDKQG
jgi:hypothetical protein